jgi:hypothetical protein
MFGVTSVFPTRELESIHAVSVRTHFLFPFILPCGVHIIILNFDFYLGRSTISDNTYNI